MQTPDFSSFQQRARRLAWLLSGALGFIFAGPVAGADGVGTITGRVLNPATGEYVRNAEVTARGGALVAISDDNGYYTLRSVPAGAVTVEVSYTGAKTSSAILTVAAGQTVSRDFELTSSLTGAASAAEVVKLGAFVVASERDGNAKAIMEQKNSMNITNSVASDVFGDVAEGNAAEFLKNIPGVDLFLVQGEIVNVRLRGLGAEYNSVTIDGVRLASADANKGAAGDARAFSFEFGKSFANIRHAFIELDLRDLTHFRAFENRCGVQFDAFLGVFDALHLLDGALDDFVLLVLKDFHLVENGLVLLVVTRGVEFRA